MEIFKNIATVVGCISACFGLLITIIKPLRQQIINSIARKAQSDKAVQDIKLLSDKIDILVEDNKKIREHMQQIEENIIEDQSDRLKAELSNYYNRCCRGLQIFPEEMLRVDEVYHRYHDELHLNHIGTNMYDVIAQYYKSQDFLQESCNHHN